jgi:hypothetical protein
MGVNGTNNFPMDKKLTNYFAYNVIKRQSASGSISVFELSQKENPDKRLIFFIEIEASDKDNETITDFLTDELEKQFFNAPTQNLEYGFENALAKANIKVKDILLSKPKNWLNKIHIIVAAIKNDELHLASVGNMHAYLVHQDKVVDILSSNMSAGQGQNSLHTPNPVKLFSNIVSGKLAEDNAIVLTNEAVLDYLSVERIRKLAKEFTPAETVAKLTELLQKAPENKQFGVTAFKRSKAQQTENQETEPDYVEEAEREVEVEEEIIEKYLKPEEVDRIEKSSLTYKNVLRKTKKISGKYTKIGLTLLLAYLSKILEKSQIGLSKLLKFISKLPTLIKLVWKNRDARDYHLSKIFSKTKNRSEYAKQQISNIPKKQKIIILSIIGLVLVFVGSIVIRAQENKEQDIQENISIDVSSIEQKINEAEAALIYKNESGARQFLSEAQDIISNLKSENPNNEQTFEELELKITNLQNKSEKKSVLNDLSPLINIIPSPISVKETGLLFSNNYIFYYDGVGEKISQLDIENGLLLTLPFENQGIESFNTAADLTNSTISLLLKDKVLIVDVEDETIKKQRFDYNPSSSAPIASYGGNLYTFPPTKDDIIRYRRAGTGFTTAQKWMQQDYDLSSMVDISVDGFIYTLDNNGDIHAFLKGRFNKIIPFPANNRPTNNISFYTNDKIDNFYILDSGNNRIISMTKTGELNSQYISDKFSNASDIIMGDEEAMLYVLAGDKIYQIETQ